MDVAIGLPATVPGIDGRTLVEWAREGERHGFSSLGTIDRIVYPNYEPLVALAAAAAVTERIRLLTSVLLGPLRTNTALLAKQAATLDNLSGGRLVLGIGLGAREDDYAVSGVEQRGRGARLDAQLEELKRLWADADGADGVGPPPATPGGPQVIVGGGVDASFARAARHGEGWIMGGGTPDQFRAGAAAVSEAWSAAGRSGEPRTMALAYFALGPTAASDADAYLHHYYGWLGDVADAIAGSAATDEETVRAYVEGFDQAGCDELVLFPCSRELDQVELLAAALA